jgi:hypothetical protein
MNAEVRPMPGDESRQYHAGDAVQDLCRACKMVRAHTVLVADGAGEILRVICDFCGSQHNYRGGETPERAPKQSSAPAGPATVPPVTEREGRYPVTNFTTPDGGRVDLEMLMRKIIREETGLTPVPMAEKWLRGEMVLRPGNADLQEKSLPIETFFHKIVMLRNRLRVLEQQINGAEIPEDLKIKLQAYITGCYGTLTSFNVLFAEEEDRFRGGAGGD